MILLTKKRFLPLFITQFFGAFNDNAFKNAFLMWFTYDVVQFNNVDATTMLTLAAGIFILPFFLLSATAGQIADKYDKAWLAVKIKQAEILLMLGCSYFFYIKNIYGLLFILFGMGVHSTFFGPIKYSLLPEHLLENELIAGNGLLESSTFLAILFGTIFGGLIVHSQYGLTAFAILVLLFSGIGYAASTHIPSTKKRDHELVVGWNVLSDTLQIIRYARKEPNVWLAIIGISCFWFFGSVFLTQFPTFTKEIIGGDEHIVILFLTIFSIGVGSGSLLCNKMLAGKINACYVPYAAIGMFVSIIILVICTLQFGLIRADSLTLLTITEFLKFSPNSIGIVIGLFSFSFFSGIFVVPLYAIMQHKSQPKFLSRIVAANNVLNAMFMVLAGMFSLIIFAFNLNVLALFLALGVLTFPLFIIASRIVNRDTENV